MRILIKDGAHLKIQEIKEAYLIDNGTAVCIPELHKKFLAGNRTEEAFHALFQDGFLDLTPYEAKRHVMEVLL